jgi:predicted membrane channel-forming protein YqfA (hemolysin III family)
MARTGDDTWDMAHACTAAAAICHYIAMWFVVF